MTTVVIGFEVNCPVVIWVASCVICWVVDGLVCTSVIEGTVVGGLLC